MTLNSKSFSEKQIHLSGLGSFYILSFCMIALFFSACGSYSHDKHYKKNKNFGLETEDTAGDSESEEDPNGVDVTPETSEKPPVGPGNDKDKSVSPDSGQDDSGSTDDDDIQTPPAEDPRDEDEDSDNQPRPNKLMLSLAYEGAPQYKSVEFIENPKATRVMKAIAYALQIKKKIEDDVYKMRLSVETNFSSGGNEYSEIEQTLKLVKNPARPDDPVVPTNLVEIGGLEEGMINSVTTQRFLSTESDDFLEKSCPSMFSCLSMLHTRNDLGLGMTFCYVDRDTERYTVVPNSIEASSDISIIYKEYVNGGDSKQPSRFLGGANAWVSRFFEAVRFNASDLDCTKIEIIDRKNRIYKIGSIKSFSAYQFKTEVRISKNRFNANLYNAEFRNVMTDPKIPASEIALFYETRTGLQAQSTYVLSPSSYYPLELTKSFGFTIPKGRNDPILAIKLNLNFQFVKKLDLPKTPTLPIPGMVKFSF